MVKVPAAIKTDITNIKSVAKVRMRSGRASLKRRNETYRLVHVTESSLFIRTFLRLRVKILAILNRSLQEYGKRENITGRNNCKLTIFCSGEPCRVVSGLDDTTSANAFRLLMSYSR